MYLNPNINKPNKKNYEKQIHDSQILLCLVNTAFILWLVSFSCISCVHEFMAFNTSKMSSKLNISQQRMQRNNATILKFILTSPSRYKGKVKGMVHYYCNLLNKIR